MGLRSNKAPLRVTQSVLERALVAVFLVWTFVAVLLFHSRPSNITKFVVAVYIWIAIQTMTGWAFTNGGEDVGKENFKVIPTSADRNAESTVVFIRDCVWIGASTAHGLPSPIKMMDFSIPGVTVSQVSDHAATGSNFALYEAGSRGMFFISTIASAMPQDIACIVSARSWVNCGQSTETLVRDIAVSGHRTVSTVRGSSGEVSVQALTSLRIIA